MKNFLTSYKKSIFVKINTSNFFLSYQALK